MRTIALASLFALAACADNQVTLSDDIVTESTFFTPTSGATDRLHTPYVRGASIGLFAETGDAQADTSGWSFQSSNPAVFSIGTAATTSDQFVSATGVASSAGSAVLSVVDALGRTIVSEPIEVQAPDSARLESSGPLVIGQSDSAAQVSAPNLVTAGTTTFLVRWFANGVELSGHGVLTANSTGLDTQVETTFSSVQRDWLQVSARYVAGPQSVEVLADGASVMTVPVQVVVQSAIANIALEGQDESRAYAGEWLAVLAQATDASGAPIYGVAYNFDLDGAAQDPQGDLFRYQYAPGAPETLTARIGTTQSSATIHASSGYVGSDNDLGCSSTGGASGTAELLALLGLAALLARKTQSGNART